MDTDRRFPGGIRANDPSKPEPEPDAEDDEADVDDPVDPDPTWKHPDDGKSLSDLDEEFPLKP
jgi:hypothetical protein